MKKEKLINTELGTEFPQEKPKKTWWLLNELKNAYGQKTLINWQRYMQDECRRTSKK